jgi:hypothetical protein
VDLHAAVDIEPLRRLVRADANPVAIVIYLGIAKPIVGPPLEYVVMTGLDPGLGCRFGFGLGHWFRFGRWLRFGRRLRLGLDFFVDLDLKPGLLYNLGDDFLDDLLDLDTFFNDVCNDGLFDHLLDLVRGVFDRVSFDARPVCADKASRIALELDFVPPVHRADVR